MVFHFRQLRQTSFTARDICKVNDKVKTGVRETLLNEAIESSLDWCAAALGQVRDGVLQRDIEPGTSPASVTTIETIFMLLHALDDVSVLLTGLEDSYGTMSFATSLKCNQKFLERHACRK
jgi:hypothetical protein